MRRTLFYLPLLFSFVTNISFANNDVNTVCARTSEHEIFVMNLINNDYGSTKFCTLDSYKSDGEECESHWGGIISWTTIADLNQDGYFDVILNQSSGAPWTGLLPFSVLINCGNNTFIAIFGEEFTWVNIKDAITSNQWLQLEAQYVALRQAGVNVGESQDYILQFDEEKFSYKAIKSGNPKIVDDPNFDFPRFVSPNLNIPWNEFPANIPHPTVTNDGIFEACITTFQDRVYGIAYGSDGQYAWWCKEKCTGRPSLDDPDAYQIVYEYSRFDSNFTASKMYRWKGRFFNTFEPEPDWVAVGKNNAGEYFAKFDIYLTCYPPNGTDRLKTLSGFFTRLEPVGDTSREHLFADLRVERQCVDKRTGKRQSRTFVLKFDKTRFEYGPPNGDPDLIQPCTDKEMSLPFDSEAESA